MSFFRSTKFISLQVYWKGRWVSEKSEMSICLSTLIILIIITVIRDTMSSSAASISEQARLVLGAVCLSSYHHLHPYILDALMFSAAVFGCVPCAHVSPVSSALGHVPPRCTSVRDWPDGRQRQRKELHRQAAGGFGRRPD